MQKEFAIRSFCSQGLKCFTLSSLLIPVSVSALAVDSSALSNNNISLVNQSQLSPSYSIRYFDLEGTLEVRAELHAHRRQSVYYLFHTDDGRTFGLRVSDRPNDLPVSGTRLKIRYAESVVSPVYSQSEPHFEALLAKFSDILIISPVDLKAIPSSFGPQKTIVFLMNFQDKPTDQPWTLESMTNRVFTEVSNFDYETSFHQTTLTGQVINWYTVPVNSTDACRTITDAISQAAVPAAAQAGVDLTSYTRRVFLFPKVPTCDWAGLGTVGIIGKYSQAWMNGNVTLHVIAHEMGHNFGLHHANGYYCGGTSPIGNNCENKEYLDPADTMGNPYGAQFNALHKEQLGWLSYGSSPPIQTVTSSTKIRLEPFETITSNVKALKVLKEILPNGSKDYYYIEYRQSIGVDAVLANVGNLTKGAIIRIGNDTTSNSSHLLDLNPSTTTFNDAALVPGKTFLDPNAPNGGVSISVASADSTGIDVTITFGGSTPECTRANPTLKVSPEVQTGKSGSTLTYNFSLTNNDSTSCSSSSFVLDSSLQADFSNVINPASISLSPAGTGNGTVQVTSPTTSSDGAYLFTLNATNIAANTFKGAAQGTYIVKNDPVTGLILDINPKDAEFPYNTTAVFKVSLMKFQVGIANNPVELGFRGPVSWKMNLKTNQSGIGTTYLSINNSLPLGKYTIAATSQYNGETITTSTSFNVK